MTIQSIQNNTDLKGKRVIVRMPCNVPLDNGVPTDTYRLETSLPTLLFLREAGAKIIIISHIEGGSEDSLRSVLPFFEAHFPVTFVEDFFNPETEKICESMNNGDVVFFENLRKWEGEKKNDIDFSKRIASFGDIYVNEAFSVAHREHASIVGIPSLLPSYAGIHFMKEVEELSKSFTPETPFIFILGGAKVQTKLPLFKKFTSLATVVFAGGVLANDFFKAQGFSVGTSVTSDEEAPLDLLKSDSFLLPLDVTVERHGKKVQTTPRYVLPEDAIFDVGEKTIERLRDEIMRAKYVIWNGPVGYCEKGFCDGTRAIADALIESNAYSIVGGGDTLATLSEKHKQAISFVSIGGGAMLDFLANGTLPGIKVLEQDRKS